MQYVRNLSGSVAKTWNSINPATLSGAIDVIVVEQSDGSLACSPFHVRFGKFMTLRPYDRKVEFWVNDAKQDYFMKLGEGGEAFFVFETTGRVPESLQTSPLVSPAQSPQQAADGSDGGKLPEPEPFDLRVDDLGALNVATKRFSISSGSTLEQQATSDSDQTLIPPSPTEQELSTNSAFAPPPLVHSNTDETLPSHKSNALKEIHKPLQDNLHFSAHLSSEAGPSRMRHRSASPPPVSTSEAMTRAINVSKKLWSSNIPAQVTDSGDLMLDMTGYKATPEDSLRAEALARKILAEEFEENYDIGALFATDDQGNVWIYSSEEAKEAAGHRAGLHLNPKGMASDDAISDPGYHSDDARDDLRPVTPTHQRRDSDSAVDMSNSDSPNGSAGDMTRNYAKTLRLTSEQLKALNLRPGANSMSFSVDNGKTNCQAYMYLWSYDVPIVISDIDGTITKSDALGHVLNMIGRDWTHLGVAKLYTDIVANGYNIFYLTSRSVGQADTTRNYLNSVVQDGHRLPKGPVIMSPDRTMAALRREIYLRKPEVFKMACLRDIMNLFVSSTDRETPFYAGFGNRLTDALSYRSVNIPSTRIFTINSNAEVSLDLLSLNKYKTGYSSMREIVDHYFPPVTLLVNKGGEDFTDFNYWRERPLDLDDFSASESEYDDDEGTVDGSLRSEDDGDMDASYFSENIRESFDESATGLEESIMESVEGADELEAELMESLELNATDDGEDLEEDEGGEDEYSEDQHDQNDYTEDDEVDEAKDKRNTPRQPDIPDFQELDGTNKTSERKRAATLKAEAI